MDSQIVSAAVQGGATLLTGLLAAGAIIYQIGRQGHHGIEQGRESERLKLKVEIYKEIVAICAAQENASIELSTKIRVLRGQMSVVTSHPSLDGLRATDVSWLELHELYGEAHQRAIAVITLVEQWRVIELRLDLFQLAVNVGLHDVRAAWPGFSIAAQAVLPPSNIHSDGSWRPPSDAVLWLAREADALVKQLMKLDAWVTDFQAEMQSQLLEDLFGQRVPPREPIDPDMFAIRLDQYDELKRRLHYTEWGRDFAATLERARQAVEAKSEPIAP